MDSSTRKATPQPIGAFDAPEHLAPGLLIAVPGLSDPLFSHSVVLLIESGPTGSYGMVVNRPAPVGLGALLDFAGIPRTVQDGKHVWIGGPVQPQAGLVLYLIEPGMADYEPQSDVVPGLRVSSSMELLRDIAKGKGPRTFALFLGRASWAPGQLEQELAQGVWLPSEADTALLFSDDTEGTWRNALHAMGADPAIVSSTAGEA